MSIALAASMHRHSHHLTAAWPPAAHPAGFNHPQLVRFAASPDPTRQRYLANLLDRAEELGLRVFRTWAHFEGGYAGS